ncbi:MAG: NRDE family protein [Alphaproteobacteria bacterium]
MCTIVLLRRPDHAWPLIFAANRDERLDRPWRSPGRHWPEQPGIVAGRDELAGGTWLGVNDSGVIAAISNRRGALGPEAGKRSRGELPLMALRHRDAAAAAAAICDLDTRAYRAFNLVIADRDKAWWCRNLEGNRTIERFPISDGVTMLTAGDLDDPTSPRIRAFLPRFRAAPPPDPDARDWAAWEALMASREGGESREGEAAMTVVAGAFGTVSSSLLALPAAGGKPIWRFAPGRPDRVAYAPLAL